MKVKTLRYKETKEFIHIFEDGSIGTSAIPDVLPLTASVDVLKKYYEISGHKTDLDFETVEVVEFDFVEASEVGADIRNKLSSPKNLLAMIENHLGGSNDGPTEKHIKKEIEQTKVSIEYLSKLF